MNDEELPDGEHCFGRSYSISPSSLSGQCVADLRKKLTLRLTWSPTLVVSADRREVRSPVLVVSKNPAIPAHGL
jgi:hypothetical protein